jgi:hypothetical protein
VGSGWAAGSTRRQFESKAQARGMSTREVHDQTLSYVSLRTTIPPQQLADTMLFLCSPRGRTSGQAISVCGDLQTLA